MEYKSLKLWGPPRDASTACKERCGHVGDGPRLWMKHAAMAVALTQACVVGYLGLVLMPAGASAALSHTPRQKSHRSVVPAEVAIEYTVRITVAFHCGLGGLILRIHGGLLSNGCSITVYEG